jgi:hypothetical protein
MAMGVLQSAQHLKRDAARVLERQLFLADQPLAESFPLHVRHRVPELAGCITRVKDREDVGMLESGGYADFVQKAVWA